jgi:glycosyltransferase involved in cell wall biosynthesis
MIIGFVGKLSHKKGILQLLESLARVESRIDAHLVVVGDGTLRTAVLDAAVRGFRAHTFLGFQNQLRMPEVYQLMDLLVVPSKEMETWGFVVQEALACETPVLASDAVGAAPDLIRRASDGVILPYGDWRAWRAQLIAWCDGMSSVRAHNSRATSSRVPSQQTAASAFIECLRRTPSHA